ncbi:hypothetical protein PENTCL1PPCAC_25769 [Pristionchus entomophagus]|uniref:Uncharacterized protein n=1 Tax=Pristionchus entomophagus TaxID=358040 RepID=A0AAV5UB78_9BILA|nr:hypothetical protein PENTCL1PPCAC_25769 [Pristionchus entomophagus]
MSVALICLLLLVSTIGNGRAAPAPDALSDLTGFVRGIGQTAGNMAKSVPVVGGIAAPFVDGANSFVDSASRRIGK